MTIENNEKQASEKQDQTNTANVDSDFGPGSTELTGADLNQTDQTAKKKTRRGRRGGRRNHRNRTNTEQKADQQEIQAGSETVSLETSLADASNASESQLEPTQKAELSGQPANQAGQDNKSSNAQNSVARQNDQPARKSRSRSKKKQVSASTASVNDHDPGHESAKNGPGIEPENIQVEIEPINSESAETRSAAKSTGKSGARQIRRSSGSRSRGRGKTGGVESALTDLNAGQGLEDQKIEPVGKDTNAIADHHESLGEGLADLTAESAVQADVAEQGGKEQENGREGAESDHADVGQAEAEKTETGKAEVRSGKPGRSGQRQRAVNKAESSQTKEIRGRKKMFISLTPGEQVEVALTEENQLLEYYLDMLHQSKLKGNIYKGVIHNIDTNLQAAFVSYGDGKNGFLQIDEIHPEYWQAHHEPAKGKKLPPIQKVLRNGQEVLVQVVKEPIGNKGAFLTTWISLAGRFLVLTPGQEQIGVSRKVEDDAERARLKELVNGIDPGQDMGVIVRTVSAGTTKTTLRNDLQYLKRLWKDIRKKATEVAAPALVHHEPGLPERAVRDYLTDDVCEIWVDNAELAERVRSMVSLLFPRKKDLVHLHTDQRQSLWERFNLLRQFDNVYSREVFLPSGGRLVFDQTEALMAIDINSGKISGKGNFEDMAYKTNMEAAEVIARHLRLRDIGGQVVIDFIEMRETEHTQNVEKALRQAMKSDRARHDIGHISSFGLLELVRQRMGSSALSNTMEPCQFCGGTGQRRNMEWQAQQCLRDLRRQLRISNLPVVAFETSRELGMYLLNHKREAINEMEQEFARKLEITLKI